MNLQSKFGYCIITQTLNIALCKRDGITDRQTDKRTGRRKDSPITRCPRRTFQAAGIKKWEHLKHFCGNVLMSVHLCIFILFTYSTFYSRIILFVVVEHKTAIQ